MTVAFTSATTIGQPVGPVFDRLVDWGSAAQWMPGVEALRAEGPLAAGTTLVFTARGKERRCTIAAVEPGRSITLRSVRDLPGAVRVAANFVPVNTADDFLDLILGVGMIGLGLALTRDRRGIGGATS